MSDETRARVRSAADDLGYVASTSAVSLATGRTNTIGVVMPYLNRWFFAEVLEGIQECAAGTRARSHAVRREAGDARPPRIFDDYLARKRFDGLIAVGLEPDDHEVERLVSSGRRLSAWSGRRAGHDGRRRSTTAMPPEGRPSTSSHSATVGSRSSAACRTGTGRRSTGVGSTATVPRWRMPGSPTRHRHIPSDVTLPGGYAAAADVLGDSRDRPTGIVAIVRRGGDRGDHRRPPTRIQVPSDLSVIGIDDHEFAEMFSLTTLQQVPREQGRIAVELLLDHIAEPDLVTSLVRIKAKLVVRNSTSALDARRSAVAVDGRQREKRR